MKDGYKYAKEIKLSVSKHGEAAEHAKDAIAQGKPDVLTIARPGAAANRSEAIGGVDKVAGKQLDEYPPAMFAEAALAPDVKAINPSNNMSAGRALAMLAEALPRW
ncbi:MAG: sporulation protein [Xanthomonadales bacterium]|nr:sporulation protein [Xanthomonadales bacterium]